MTRELPPAASYLASDRCVSLKYFKSWTTCSFTSGICRSCDKFSSQEMTASEASCTRYSELCLWPEVIVSVRNDSFISGYVAGQMPLLAKRV